MAKLPIVNNDSWLEPYESVIRRRKNNILNKIEELGEYLPDFANGHLYFGLHYDEYNWHLREWAPNATSIFLIGTCNNWQETEKYRFQKKSGGTWQLVLPLKELEHKDLYKLKIYWDGGSGERIPAWTNRVVQDPDSLIFNAQVWAPSEPYRWKNDKISPDGECPIIYEAHIGMATEEYKVGQYDEFRRKVLPEIKKAGYNTIQIMAVQEHPYYGSFGYHVSSLFAPSSRFGTPDELKELIDDAHGMGIRIIMDLVHSHAVRNEVEGLGKYDGTTYQFFHEGPKGEHLAWDSLCYNYGKNEVLHFLLSNLKYWLDEYRFDGFRFDGVTSMLYLDHGLGRDFNSYDMYFDGGQDEEAITYLGLANNLIHETDPNAITVAEEMSGYPGLGTTIEEGGIGFDYRMAMGTPDYWIKLIKEKSDENWNVEEMFYELSRKRHDEKTVGYAESHDQALVGDKTIIFRLMDKEMYFSMNKSDENLIIDRGIALHKMIRLITIATSGNAYLNFMGNEFGHPEWIDFPREGNNWSYHYARRQWNLRDNKDLKYHYLSDFDRNMIEIAIKSNFLAWNEIHPVHFNVADQIVAFERAGLLFIFNFNPDTSFPDYGLSCNPGIYHPLLSSDSAIFGGQDRIDMNLTYRTVPGTRRNEGYKLMIYLPSRTALVLQKEKIKSVYDQ